MNYIIVKQYFTNINHSYLMQKPVSWHLSCYFEKRKQNKSYYKLKSGGQNYGT